MLYVGSMRKRPTSHITVMDENGTVLTRKRVPSSSAGLSDVVRRYQEPIRAVLEASYNWDPMYDWLNAPLSSGVFLMTSGSAWVEPLTGDPYERFGRGVPGSNP